MEDLTNNEEKDEADVAPESSLAEPESQAVDEKEGKSESDIAAKIQDRIRNFPSSVKTAVRYSLSLSIIFFVLYMAGSMYAPGVPDTLLFMLLRLMRYSGFLLLVFSLVALGFGVHRLVNNPCVRTALYTLLYFFLILLGAVFIMFSLLIVGISAGN